MADPELETEPQSTKPKKGKGTRARIEIEGETSRTTVDDVMETASGGKRGSTATAGGKGKPIRFDQAIRDPNNRIIAKRISPQTTLDGEPLGDEYHDLLAHDRMTVEDIKRDLSEARGGKRWHVKVEDPDGKILAADTITVHGEPKLEPGFDEGGGGGMGDGLEGATETIEDRLANDPEILKARKEVELVKIKAEAEEKQAQLEEARARRVAAERAAKGLPPVETGNGNGHKTSEDDRLLKMIDAANAPLKAQLAASEKALDDERARNRARDEKAERKADQEALLAPLRQMQENQQKSIDAMLQKMNAPPPPPTGPGTDALLAKLDSMQVSLRSEFKDNINTVVNGIKDGLTSKIDTLASTVNLLMAKGNDPVTAAMLQLATKSGQGGPAQQDPFTMMAKAMETMKALQAMTKNDGGVPQDFPSYLVDRVTSLAPDVMDFIKEQQANATVVTKEMLEAKMKELGGKMWQGLDQTIKSEIRNIRVQTPALPATPTPAPASAASVGPPPPPVKPTPAPAGVGATPPVAGPSPTAAPPTAGPTPAPTPAPGAPVTYPFGMDQQDFMQTQKRVNHVLKILTNEMRLGVQAMKWPEQAFAHLPKPLIDALMPATTEGELRAIFEPFGDPAAMQMIGHFCAETNPQHEWYRKWLSDGIQWIKDAVADQSSDGEEGEPVVEEP
jgi:hypothetical protein